MDVLNAMAHVPSNLRFTADHLWLGADRNGWIVGITRFAVAKLGNLVYIDVPRAGTALTTGLAFSFVRRARQVVWIVIGLAVLLVMRWSARRAAASAPAA